MPGKALRAQVPSAIRQRIDRVALPDHQDVHATPRAAQPARRGGNQRSHLRRRQRPLPGGRLVEPALRRSLRGRVGQEGERAGVAAGQRIRDGARHLHAIQPRIHAGPLRVVQDDVVRVPPLHRDRQDGLRRAREQHQAPGNNAVQRQHHGRGDGQQRHRIGVVACAGAQVRAGPDQIPGPGAARPHRKPVHSEADARIEQRRQPGACRHRGREASPAQQNIDARRGLHWQAGHQRTA